MHNTGQRVTYKDCEGIDVFLLKNEKPTAECLFFISNLRQHLTSSAVFRRHPLWLHRSPLTMRASASTISVGAFLLALLVPSVRAQDCAPALYRDLESGGCQYCPDGFTAPVGSTSIDQCDLPYCEAGQQPSYNSITGKNDGPCVSCPLPGQYSYAGFPECLSCQAGFIPNADKSYCDYCPESTYEEGGICVDCPGGAASQIGSTSVSQCQIAQCPPGQGQYIGSTECAPCQLDSFSPGGTGGCQQCGRGSEANA